MYEYKFDITDYGNKITVFLRNDTTVRCDWISNKFKVLYYISKNDSFSIAVNLNLRDMKVYREKRRERKLNLNNFCRCNLCVRVKMIFKIDDSKGR